MGSARTPCSFPPAQVSGRHTAGRASSRTAGPRGPGGCGSSWSGVPASRSTSMSRPISSTCRGRFPLRTRRALHALARVAVAIPVHLDQLVVTAEPPGLLRRDVQGLRVIVRLILEHTADAVRGGPLRGNATRIPNEPYQLHRRNELAEPLA